jgi:hypothetical protein
MIDLDAARAEREAARKEAGELGPVVKIGGEECQLPPELAYDVIEVFRGMNDEFTAGGAMAALVPALLGEEHYPKFLALEPPPSLKDVEVLVHGLMEEYGIDNPLV